MKFPRRIRLGVLLVLAGFAGPSGGAVVAGMSVADEAAGASGRALTPFESSLVGSWFNGGDVDKRAFIASTGAKLFAINESNDTLELQASGQGTVIGKRADYQASGVVNGDYVLWSNGTWWSRHPVPGPIDVRKVWDDAQTGWINLRSFAPVTMEGCADFERIVREKAGSVVRGVTFSFDESIAAHAPGTVGYAFDKPVTEFRAEVALGDGGRMGAVVFKVKTDAGVVWTSNEISHPRGNVQRVSLKFAPSKTLTLIAEPGENNYEDWSAWLVPQVR